MNVKPEYSAALELILGSNQLESKNLLDLLKNRISEKVYKSTPDYLKLLFNTEVSDDVVAKLNPFFNIEYAVNGINGYSSSKKYLSFHFKRLFNQKEIE